MYLKISTNSKLVKIDFDEKEVLIYKENRHLEKDLILLVSKVNDKKNLYQNPKKKLEQNLELLTDFFG